MVPLSKSGVRKHRGFESHPLRHPRDVAHGPRWLPLDDVVKPRHLRHDELAPFGRQFDPNGYDLRVLPGADHGLASTIMQATIAPGRGPRRHRHPHPEIITVHDGSARFEIDETTFDGVAGDVIVIPAGAWHRFVVTGDRDLRNTAIHENVRPVTEWEDGERQE